MVAPASSAARHGPNMSLFWMLVTEGYLSNFSQNKAVLQGSGGPASFPPEPPPPPVPLAPPALALDAWWWPELVLEVAPPLPELVASLLPIDPLQATSITRASAISGRFMGVTSAFHFEGVGNTSGRSRTPWRRR